MKDISDINAEEAVIGSILIDDSMLKRIDLQADDFFSEPHRFIFDGMLKLQDTDTAINQITVAHALNEAGKLERVGGTAYLSHLISICPTSLDCPVYAEIVKEKSLYRQMFQAAEAGDVQSLDYLVKQSHRQSSLITPKQASLAMFSLIEGEFEGLSWGYSDLDNATAMIQPAELIIIGARPGVGKTEFMLNVLWDLVKNRKKSALFCSLEMSIKAIQMRITAMETGIPVWKLRTRNLTPDERVLVSELAGETSGWTWHFLDGRKGTKDIYRHVEKLEDTIGLDIVMIDYLGLLQDCFEGGRNLSKVNMVSNASANLKAMANELDIPVMVACQLNRGSESREDARPKLSDLRDSGSIEQDADMVLFLYRDELYHLNTPDKGILEIKPAKLRQLGEQPAIKLVWLSDKHRYASMAKENGYSANSEGRVNGHTSSKGNDRN